VCVDYDTENEIWYKNLENISMYSMVSGCNGDRMDIQYMSQMVWEGKYRVIIYDYQPLVHFCKQYCTGNGN